MHKIAAKIFLITALLFFTLFVKAQRIKIIGIVKDSLSNQPLQNATVIIKGITFTSFNKISLTNSKGLFTFQPPLQGLYKISISYSGYKTKVKDSVECNMDSVDLGLILLTLNLKNLNEVVISNKKPFLIVSANKITLNVGESPIASGSNVYDLLKTAPSVFEQNDNLSFRGKSINILINGRSSHLHGEDLKAMLTNMQADNIEKIEILPNPSSKYDAQGGSVINIVLAKNKAYGTNYVFTTGIGTGKYLKDNIGLDVNYRNKNLNVYGGYNFAGSRSYNQLNSIRFYLKHNFLAMNMIY